jgi:hypothetical protein
MMRDTDVRYILHLKLSRSAVDCGLRQLWFNVRSWKLTVQVAAMVGSRWKRMAASNDIIVRPISLGVEYSIPS